MQTLLLLVVIAILLFGSSAVIGAVGAILGFVASVIALAYFCYLTGIDTMLAIAGVMALVSVATFSVLALQKLRNRP